MKKSIKELAVGDWVLVEGLLIDRPARDAAQVISISNSMIVCQQKNDRWGEAQPKRKVKKSIIAVFDNYNEAEEFCEFIYKEIAALEEQTRALRVMSQVRIAEYAKKYQKANDENPH